MGIFKAQNALKPVFGRSSAPDRIGELTMLPWRGGHQLLIPLPLDASGVSISRFLASFGASLLIPLVLSANSTLVIYTGCATINMVNKHLHNTS